MSINRMHERRNVRFSLTACDYGNALAVVVVVGSGSKMRRYSLGAYSISQIADLQSAIQGALQKNGNVRCGDVNVEDHGTGRP